MLDIKSSDYGTSGSSKDVWDSGDIHFIRKKTRAWQGELSYPLIALRFMDTVRRDQRWFRHLNYPYLALELTCQGEVEYRQDQKIIRASSGTLYVVSHHSDVAIVNADNSTRRRVTLLITGTALDSIAAALHLDSDQLIKLSEPEAMIADFEHLGELIADPQGGAENSAATYNLLLKISEELHHVPEELLPMLNLIHQDLSASHSMPEFAQLCGISPATLRRRFQEYFQMSPHRYILGQRLTLARDLLRQNQISIKAVALRCGFKSQLNFMTAFKNAYGMSPRTYRQQNSTLDEVE